MKNSSKVANFVQCFYAGKMRARCLRRRKEGGEAGSQERRDKSWSQPRSVEEGPMLLDQGPTFLERGLWREDQISRSGNIVQNNQTLPLIPVQHSTNFYQSFDFLQKKKLKLHVILPLLDDKTV